MNSQSLKFTRTFGLGGINALLFIILVISGLLLRFSYIPTPENAYNSILSLQNNSLFGNLLRNIHHWSAMLIVITAFLHLLRVFYSQSIYYERSRNWFYGLGLFIVILAFNFTGYLLPWDQLSYWAVTIMTNIMEYIPFIGEGFANLIRGGELVNQNTLLNFYNFHTALLPLLFMLFIAIHFWLIRKANGVTIADNSEHNKVPVNPYLINKEIIAALILIIFISLISIFFNAPLLEKANPMISPNPSKAPWYFMGIQELLIHLHPLIVSLIIPLGLIILFISIARTTIEKNRIGVWFYSQKGKQITIYSATFAFVFTALLILSLEYWIHLEQINLPSFVSTGIIPLLLYLIPISGFILYIKTKQQADKIEILISIVSIIFASYIIMSFIGICLRGEAMHLIF